MADILTNIRELSVFLPYYIKNIDKITPSLFIDICTHNVENCKLSVNDISNNTKEFSTLEMNTLSNSFILGNHIKSKMRIEEISNCIWLGNEKNDLIDVSINEFNFSLKENSWILKNTGLYQLLNFLTNSNRFSRGVHIFEEFSSKELDVWFSTTLAELKKLRNFTLQKKNYSSFAKIENNTLVLKFNETEVTFENIDSLNYNEFKNRTNAKLREKVFSKWIAQIPKNSEYEKYKKICSEKAGENLVYFIKKNLVKTSPQILNFFNLSEESYFYAKNDGKEISLYKVPSINEIDYNDYFVEDVSFSVPKSQLNIFTKIKNKRNNSTFILRNEVRYSHGQLNGTPEAKLYHCSGNLEEFIYEEI